MRTILSILILLFFSSVAHAAESMVWITWTNPSMNARQVWAVDPETNDSTLTQECDGDGGAPLTDLSKVRIWRWPISGGLPFIYAEVNERFREGLGDSTQVPTNAHIYATSLDVTGNQSCPSPTIYTGTLTGVDPAPVGDRIEILRIFDIQGRMVSSARASGRYFFKAWWRSGRITTGKLPPLLK